MGRNTPAEPDDGGLGSVPQWLARRSQRSEPAREPAEASPEDVAEAQPDGPQLTALSEAAADDPDVFEALGGHRRRSDEAETTPESGVDDRSLPPGDLRQVDDPPPPDPGVVDVFAALRNETTTPDPDDGHSTASGSDDGDGVGATGKRRADLPVDLSEGSDVFEPTRDAVTRTPGTGGRHAGSHKKSRGFRLPGRNRRKPPPRAASITPEEFAAIPAQAPATRDAGEATERDHPEPPPATPIERPAEPPVGVPADAPMDVVAKAEAVVTARSDGPVEVVTDGAVEIVADGSAAGAADAADLGRQGRPNLQVVPPAHEQDDEADTDPAPEPLDTSSGDGYVLDQLFPEAAATVDDLDEEPLDDVEPADSQRVAAPEPTDEPEAVQDTETTDEPEAVQDPEPADQAVLPPPVQPSTAPTDDPAPNADPESAAAPAATDDPAPEANAVPRVVVFGSDGAGTRGTLGGLLLLALLGLAWTGYLYWQDRTTQSLVLAGAAALVVCVLLVLRSSATSVTVRVEDGVVDIKGADSHHQFNLASPNTEVEIDRKESRHWRVRIHRRGMEPYDIDGSMVDGSRFVPLVEHYREQALAKRR